MTHLAQQQTASKTDLEQTIILILRAVNFWAMNLSCLRGLSSIYDNKNGALTGDLLPNFVRSVYHSKKEGKRDEMTIGWILTVVQLHFVHIEGRRQWSQWDGLG